MKTIGWIKQTTMVLGLCALAAPLAACSSTMDRMANIGKVPEMAAIENPVEKPDYKPVSLPMPEPNMAESKPNSLWQAGRQRFFKDQRAAQIGDILTVMVEIEDEAELDNKSSRSRSNTESAGLGALGGLETKLGKFLPDAVDPTNLIDADSTTSNEGEGSIEREETVKLKVAALITQILPNGNMVVQGRQEVRVNYEVRELLVAGIIRPEDITTDNTISYDKIAEARIAYGGRGHISDFQQPRYGQQFFDVVFPF